MSKKTLEELREDLKIARSNDLDFRERFNEKSKELLAQIDKLKNQFNEANSELIGDCVKFIGKIRLPFKTTGENFSFGVRNSLLTEKRLWRFGRNSLAEVLQFSVYPTAQKK